MLEPTRGGGTSVGGSANVRRRAGGACLHLPRRVLPGHARLGMMVTLRVSSVRALYTAIFMGRSMWFLAISETTLGTS